MPLLVTSASGASGDGFGALLASESDGSFRGTFIDDDRIADPRGLAAGKLAVSKLYSRRTYAASSAGH